MPDDVTATPLRSLPTTSDGGVRVIRDTGSTWLDGSEELLLERITSGAYALDSLSDELFATATSWPERYHLSPSRANVIRALDLPPDAAVLEIGAGCGAITRYLGEVCRTVDALEPTLARARVAAARTADLAGVTVFSGEVSDVPQVPAYDVVVVVGVLEYVGGGGRDLAPYLAFLEQLRGTLAPGGQLVVAIENPLGVKYLAGAPEDHSGQVFHSVEGYPVDGPARTFTRSTLRTLVEQAGLHSPRVLGAFPDYKLTRMVLDDALLERAGTLAVRVPHFPSPDWVVDRPVLLDEELLWAQLVEAGGAGDFANSFLLVAGRDEAAPALWPEGRLGTYFSLRRRRAFQVAKRVEDVHGEVRVRSRLLGTGSDDDLSVLAYDEAWTEGRSLMVEAIDAPERLDDLVQDWVTLLRARAHESSPDMPIDVLPHNIHYAGGRPTVIDDEWRSSSTTLEHTLLRGALLLARDLTAAGDPSRWGSTSALDLAVRIAKSAGLDVDDDALRQTVDREAALQARIGGGAPGTEAYATTRAVVRDQLTETVLSPGGRKAPERLWEERDRMREEAVEARDLLFATGQQLDAERAAREDDRAERQRLEEELAALRAAEAARLAQEQAEQLARERTLRYRVLTRARRVVARGRRVVARVRRAGART